MPDASHSNDTVTRAPALPLRYCVLALSVLGAWAVLPLWAPLVLAIWTALLVQPLYAWLEQRLAGKSRAAAAATSLVVLVLLAPVVIIAVVAIGTASSLSQEVEHWKAAGGPLDQLLPGSSGFSLENLESGRALEMVRKHGSSALKALTATFGALATAALAVVVYVLAFHATLVDGPRARRWLLGRELLPRHALVRLGSAFEETGRGLFVGIGLTALIQASVLTAGYVVVGLPQPVLLGLVTALGALIPTIGTAVVWVPATLVLFATGKTTEALALLAIGSVASVIDNFIRPWLSRYGKLELHPFVVFVAMLGGLAAFGALGIVLGPLFVRLAVEGLELWREHRHANT